MKKSNNSSCSGCGCFFYSKHGNQEYCSHDCYQYFYNKYQRDNNRHRLMALTKNRNILEESLGNLSELKTSYEALEQIGFDFYIYDKKIPYDKKESIFYINYGEFKANITVDNLIFIKRK